MSIKDEVFREFPILETPRLFLRALNDDDAKVIFDMRTNDLISQFIARNKLNHLDEALNLIHRTNDLFKNKQGIGWAGFTNEGNQLIGTCGFNKIDFENRRAEIGGELSVSSWGRNFAKEAVQAILHCGFDKLKLNSIEARVSPDNKSAIYLLSLMGFVKEAHFKNYIFFKEAYSDLAVYTLHKKN